MLDTFKNRPLPWLLWLSGWAASHKPKATQACVPDWESNQCPFGSQASAQSRNHTSQGQKTLFLILLLGTWWTALYLGCLSIQAYMVLSYVNCKVKNVWYGVRVLPKKFWLKEKSFNYPERTFNFMRQFISLVILHKENDAQINKKKYNLITHFFKKVFQKVNMSIQ